MDKQFDAYDFIVNDEDEVMLLLYAREGEPEDAVFEIDAEKMSAVLHRNQNDGVLIEELPADIFDSLQDADTLLVCELKPTENEDDTEIVYAYEADINL